MSTDRLDEDLTKLLQIVGHAFSVAECQETLGSIFASDRQGDYRAFRQTAELVAEELNEAELSDVQVIPHPADGVRKHGDWIVPQAWDAFGGELIITAPENARRLVVKHPDEPLCIAMYSAPTSRDDIEADLVLWEEVPDGEDLTGKIVLTSQRIRGVADQALGRGAAGIISDYAHPHAVDREARYWENYCFVPKNTTGDFAFVLSPAEGDRLRRDLGSIRAIGQSLKVKTRVDTRLYDGEVDIVTGLLPGTEADGEEVLLVAHLYEIGANDNASGAAVCIETMRCLRRLIAEGRLPRPRRSVRVLLCFEQYGTIAFLDMNRERIPHIVAGLNADMVGEDQELCGSVLTLDRTPPANPSYTNCLIAWLLELQGRHYPEFRWRETCYSIHDGFISDPMLDIPTPTLLHQPDRFYHSDADTPDKVSPQTLKTVGPAAAAYAYTIAAAGPGEAQRLAELVATRAEGRLSEAAEAFVKGATEGDVAGDASVGAEWGQRLAFLAEQERRAVQSVLRLVEPKQREGLASELRQVEERVKRAADAAHQHVARSVGAILTPAGVERPPLTEQERRADAMVPERLVLGSLTLADLPPEAQAEFAAITSETFPYSTMLCSALFWADGTRSVLAIRNLLAQERGQADLAMLVRLFGFLEAYGYCRMGTASGLET